jgi:hypothetical protein
MIDEPKTLRLEYTIVCEDVRIEMTRCLSFMGILHVVHIPQLPVTVLKLCVVNHWRGVGRHLTEVRVLTPDRSQSIAASPPSPIEVPENGGADNVTVFTNVVFHQPGLYVVQTLLDSNLFSEHLLPVAEVRQQHDAITASEVVN